MKLRPDRNGAKRSPLFWLASAMMAAGLVFLGFGAWNYFFADTVDGASKTSVAKEYGVTATAKKFMEPKAATHLADVFARVVIPRLGDDWVRLVGEGTRWHPVLNDIGIGHYMGTARPGAVGNFATAAHRGGYGGSYKNIHRLVKGDLVYVQTNAGWYSYEYRQTKIVKPTDTDVIRAVPKELVGSHKGGRYMTLTSCDPIYVNTNRIIVWLEMKDFVPVSAGVPAAVQWLGKK